MMEWFAEGSAERVIDEAEAGRLLDGMLAAIGPLRRALLVPPDKSRFHSWAGPLTRMLFDRLSPRTRVEIMPALGTHKEMEPGELDEMFPGIPHDRFLKHDCSGAIDTVGTIPGDFVREVSGGLVDYPIDIGVNASLTGGGWDRIFSIGQLVPHEVMGIANYNKNIFIGVGGEATIHRTHFLSAVVGLEKLMGVADNPVRAVLNRGSAEFGHRMPPIAYLLTVRARDAADRLVTRGLYAGEGDGTFRKGAALAAAVNVEVLDRPIRKAVVRLDPGEFHSTWIGNKAVYRTRMAIADGGELLVLAPGVAEFGDNPIKQPTIDRLIARHGYIGAKGVLAKVDADPELARNLSAAAHLIHGSSEGRFRITYAIDEEKMSLDRMRSVHFDAMPHAEAVNRYDPSRLRDGWNTMPDGEEIFYVSNPGLGLWMSRDRWLARQTG